MLALWRDGTVDVDDALQVIASQGAVALVADDEGTVAGVALGVLAGTEGRIVDVTTISGDGEVADGLLDALEQTLANHGARTVASLVDDGELQARLGGPRLRAGRRRRLRPARAAAQRRGAGGARTARRADDRPGPVGSRCAAWRTRSGSSSGA